MGPMNTLHKSTSNHQFTQSITLDHKMFIKSQKALCIALAALLPFAIVASPIEPVEGLDSSDSTNEAPIYIEFTGYTMTRFRGKNMNPHLFDIICFH